MNIAVDVVALDKDGRAGGVTWLALELINGLVKYDNMNIIALCTCENREFIKRHIGDKVILESIDTGHGGNIVGRVLQKVKDNRKVQKIVKKYAVDIFFCPFGIVNYKINNVKTVSIILDVQHEFYPDFFSRRELLARKWIYRYIAHTAQKVVCISEYTRNTFCDKYGYDRDNAEVIYIAIQERFSKNDDTVLEKLGINREKYILYPANCWKHKNHERLLRAFEMFSKENPDIKLVLTGNMFGCTERLLEGISTEGVRNKIIVAGYVDEAQMHSLLKNCRGLIFPSLFEGFGIPVIEAMQQYKPVACSNTTSLPEIGCKSLFYFDPDEVDEIARGLEFILNANMTDEVIADYNDTLLKYNKQDMIEKYVRLFNQINETA